MIEMRSIIQDDYRHLISVEILLKATGDAPIMKKRKWAVDATKKIGWIIGFIRKYINSPPEESLVSAVNHQSSFT